MERYSGLGRQDLSVTDERVPTGTAGSEKGTGELVTLLASAGQGAPGCWELD